MNSLGNIATSIGELALITGTARSLRSLGGLTAQIVSEETHVDELDIADHPVEQGAAITDHAYKLPAMLTLRYGWSASPSPSPGLLGLIPPIIPQAPVDIRDIYSKLLTMQVNRVLLDVYTGKRAYKNMLLKSIEQDTTAASENSLALILVLRELNLVQTQTVQSAGVSSANDPSKVSFLPTYPTQQGGVFQLLPAPTFNPSRSVILNAGPGTP